MMNFKHIMRNKITQKVQAVKSIVSTRNSILPSMQSIPVRCKIPFGLFALGFSMKTHLSARGQIKMLSLHKLDLVIVKEKMEIMI